MLYHTQKTNPLGQIERFGLGDNLVCEFGYHPEKQTIASIHTTRNENILQDLAYEYDGFSNLASRTDNKRNLEERFTYDHLNRLTGIWLNNSRTGWMDYDPYGRMTGKIIDNLRVFSDAVYNTTPKPHAIDQADVDQGSFSEHSLTYTCFDKVKTITQGNNTLEYTYGYDRQRVFMEELANGVERTKRYVGNCEFVTETENNATTAKTLTYLKGPMGVFAVVETNGNEDALHYILKDHLGSWTTITDADGIVEQELSFDAWGTRRNPNIWQNYTVAEPVEAPMFDRGFTGHEHLYAFGLINMNGRMYDPQMSSFLSVDAYVQSPDNSQSFNRYAYCLNNPLKYTDPSGWQMIGGMTPSNPFHENWGVNFVEKAYTSVEAKQMLWSTGISTEIWMEGSEIHGGGGSPVYDEHGYFMGTDDGGLQGEAIVMKRDDFVQGMKHEEAISLATYLDENDKDAQIRLYYHFRELINRPDWDGFVTVNEGIAWAKAHCGALQNPTPDNMLYINTSRLDFGNLSVSDFENGEGNVSFVNLYTFSNVLNSRKNDELLSTVYALGKVHILLEDATKGTVSIHNDCFNDNERVTDYDWNKGGGMLRTIGIILETKRANLPKGAGFRVYYYGKGQLNR